MSVLEQIAEKIVKEQELVIGPLAWSEARKVSGITANEAGGEIKISGSKEVIDQLVARYERLFGRASQEVCKEAAASLIAQMQPAEIPSSVR